MKHCGGGVIRPQHTEAVHTDSMFAELRATASEPTRKRALSGTSLPPRPQPEPLLAGSATIRPSRRDKAQGLFPPSRSRPLNAAEPVALRTTNLRTVAATISGRHVSQIYWPTRDRSSAAQP